MKGFASNLISRHIHTEANIVPRLRGRFEAEQNSFHEDSNPAPVNPIDAFSDRLNADDNRGPDGDTETSTYRPVISATRRDTGRQQPEPEAPAQVNFSAPKAAFKRPAPLEVGPIADDFNPGNKNAGNAESATSNEPGLPGKRQTERPYQHNFNVNSQSNAVKSNDNGLVWPKPVVPENSSETTLFAGKRKSSAAPESIRGEAPSTVQVNEPVQPITTFKSSKTGMQNSVDAISHPNLSNSGLRDGGQRPFGQAAQPVIKVTIGRIEVKAVHPQAPAPVQRREPQKPVLSLDDFLSQHKRNGQ